MEKPTFTIDEVITALKKASDFIQFEDIKGSAQLNWDVLTPKAIEKANRVENKDQGKIFK